jgi:hypothetical protein
LLLFPLVVVLLAGGASQKPKEPDFSGEWVLVKATGSVSNPARALSVQQTITSTTRRGGPMKPYYSDLRIERQLDSGAVAESYKIGLIRGSVSGTAAGASSPQNERTVVAVKWQGNDLTITTGRYSGSPEQPGPYTEHQEIWSLDADGRLSIRTTDESSAAAVARATLVYQRGARSR